MLEPVTIALCAIMFLIVLYHFGVFDSKEQYLAAPNYRASLVDVDRARQRDAGGLTVTDYVLEANMLKDMPLSDRVRILG